jgi:hypothetical protein
MQEIRDFLGAGTAGTAGSVAASDLGATLVRTVSTRAQSYWASSSTTVQANVAGRGVEETSAVEVQVGADGSAVARGGWMSSVTSLWSGSGAGRGGGAAAAAAEVDGAAAQGSGPGRGRSRAPVPGRRGRGRGRGRGEDEL